jgi:hypothetical protein
MQRERREEGGRKRLSLLRKPGFTLPVWHSRERAKVWETNHQVLLAIPLVKTKVNYFFST